jgi:hypothetical protein
MTMLMPEMNKANVRTAKGWTRIKETSVEIESLSMINTGQDQTEDHLSTCVFGHSMSFGAWVTGLRHTDLMHFPLATTSALICLAAPLSAQRVQTPDAPWKSIQTAHYRIHYPARGDFEPFALEVASKIEGIHGRVTDWVGYESPKTVDVLIRDPLMEGNGMAYPFMKHPFVELWKTPPESDSAFAHFTTWPELLVTHELTHIHHLMRPLAKPRLWDKLLDLPVGPLTLKAPRWVIEGYATVIEGRVTGSGRPQGVYRAALLRQWAREGKLPDYGALNGFGGFRGGNMAYLVGSAYLEWLEHKERTRPGEKDVLKKLWRKLAEDQGRKFDAIFLGTFGFSARDGYDRFRAELTADALAFELRMKEQQLIREGELFTKVDGEVTDLAVNPDGTRLMARVITPAFKGLRVWNLNEPAKPKPESNLPIGKPSDPDIAPLMPTKKATWELGRSNGLIPEKPFWTKVAETSRQPADGTSLKGHDLIVFSVREPNDEGMVQRRSNSWRPGKSMVVLGPADTRVPSEKQSPMRAMETDGLRSIWTTQREASEQIPANSPFLPVVRTPSAAWLPAPMPDGKTLFYVQLGATGCEIRKLDLTLPPLAQASVPWGDSFFTVGAVKPSLDEPSQLPPPVNPPPARFYATGETMWSGQRSGLTLAPSGISAELGYGGTDLLGRFSWQALGAFGNLAGPRGVQVGLVYRGWRWAPSLHVFSSLERPFRQSYVPVQGFDRQRMGGELAFLYESKNTTPAYFKPNLSVERVDFMEGLSPNASRRFIGMDVGISHLWSRSEEWGLRLSAQAKDGLGRTAANNWQSQRGHMQVRIYTPWTQLLLKAESGRVMGYPTPLDRLHLGGLATSLVPASLEWNRVEQPALPSYNAMGDRMHRLRVEVGSGLRAYLEHTAVWDHPQTRSAFTKVAGLEFDFTQLIGNRDVMDRLMGHRIFIVGVHRVLSEGNKGASMQDRTVGTLSLVLRP